MWAKLKVFHSTQNMICLPSPPATTFKSALTVTFGAKSADASVLNGGSPDPQMGQTFEQPVTIEISDTLREALLLIESPVYRVNISDSSIAFGPVVGLLLGSATHRYNPIHMVKYSDRFGVYPEIGGLFYAFSPKYINWTLQSAYGLYYNPIASSWEYGRFPLPDVIYRRDFHSDPDVIRGLIRHTGGKLFNSIRFTKYELYDFINKNDELKPYLPPTEYSNDFDQIKQFIHRHNKIILKPVHLSRGRGICVIEKNGSKYQAIDFRCRQPVIYELYNDRLLENFFDVYRDLFDKYLIQKYLPLAKIGSNPFDIRVVMQKRPGGDWGCTGIECRVSNNGFLTNISRGGYALQLGEALQQAFPDRTEPLDEEIDGLCRKICIAMDTSGEHFAEFGLDIAIDEERRLWIIEANVFPSFKGFKRMDPDTYLAIRYAPMFYAASLTAFGADEDYWMPEGKFNE